MRELFEELKQYFDKTPQSVLDEDWDKVKHLNEIGPDVIEYAKDVRGLLYFEMPYSNSKEKSYSLKIDSEVFAAKDIAADSSYYFAA